MISLLMLGFLLGMRHALEADHIAAVATLATRTNTIGQAIGQGAVWGLGHTLTLFMFGSMVIWMETIMPERLAQWLEFAVGVMLVFLGLDVLRKLIRERIHVHRHRHADGASHFHAHAHAVEPRHDALGHEHQHPYGFPYRALVIGLMHGMAGSAALIVLTLETVRSPWTGMLYILLFGLGSVAGMAALTVVIAIPLMRSARGLTWLCNGLQAVVGVATFVLGLWVVTGSGS
jgi:ABC-type nickel/cobalt efflux system permease component RcnA